MASLFEQFLSLDMWSVRSSGSSFTPKACNNCPGLSCRVFQKYKTKVALLATDTFTFKFEESTY